jgi:hypothetical protein
VTDDERAQQEAMLRRVLAEFVSADSSPVPLDSAVHTMHHRWLGAQIARDEQRRAFWDMLKSKSLPGALTAVVLAIAGWGWAFFSDLFKTHWK